MAYTITYSGGSFQVDDGDLNITSTSLALPGRDYAGYGINIDQNLVNLLQNFAAPTASNLSITGQLWFNTTLGQLQVNTANGYVPLAYNSSNTDVSSNNLSVAGNLSVSGQSNLANVTVGNLTVTGRSTLGNVTLLTTGSNAIAGTITGNWTLSAGSRLNATYADLAERFESDTEYECGTVVELGGEKEITLAQQELSDRIFGVISSSAGYVMNSGAGNDKTHPAVAMTGRVPVKTKGKVLKGDRLVCAGNGYARAARNGEATPFTTIGRSLENKESESDGQVLAAVSVRL